ncbi:MAG: threonine synthase [Nitrospiraceae bacterium]|nr:threonine synthase [Nitrospiraceae bacterium]
MAWKGIVHQYGEYLPVSEKTPSVTLLEGGTPLVKAVHLPERFALPIELYLKFDGANPTGSFKDRGMAVAIPKALEEDGRAVICASTGNTSAAAAAYAARAGMKAIVLIPEGKIAFGKLAQAIIHGAHVLQVKGNFDSALALVKKIVEDYPVKLVNSINPFRIEGQKTAAFEVADALGDAPSFHALPVGNAGNITAYWKGYNEYKRGGRIGRLPRMLGFQAAGAAPIVIGRPVERPETIATAIRIGNPASWKGAENAIAESGGRIAAVTDEEILEAYRLVAGAEGIFCEPASAASIAGVLKLGREGFFSPGDRVVCTLTGHGLKDPDSVFKALPGELAKVENEIGVVRKIIEKIL